MDPFILALIILGNTISLIFGFHQLYKFIKAIRRKKSFLKSQSYMFNAFWLIIIIPILYTMCAVFISNMLFPGAGSIALVISTEDNTQTSMLSIEDDIKINLGEEVMVDLSVLSTFDKEIEMNIEISCLKNDPLCPSIKENIALKSPRFNLRPKIAIKLPIKIKAVKEWHEKNIGFNISVSYENGTNYASLPLKISVGN